jgi:tRNA(Ser,Leu) C12 N-acetylase TAN1
MSLSKEELIKTVQAQFVRQITPNFLRKLRITSGYFNQGLPLMYKNKLLNKPDDKGQIMRIFDSLQLDSDTIEQFYTAVMQSDDPVKEYLVPLVGTIAEQIFEPDSSALKANIREDFLEYDKVRELYTPAEFKNVMLQAIATGCTAMLTDFHTKKMERYPIGSDTRSNLGKQLSAKITGPFDGYTILLTEEKLKRDLESQRDLLENVAQTPEQQRTLISIVIRALLAIVNALLGRANQDDYVQVELSEFTKESAVEKRVKYLLAVVDKTLDSIEPKCGPDDAWAKSLVAKVSQFRDNLANIRDTIDMSREEGIDFEAKATSDFEGFCTRYSEELGELIKNNAEQNTAETALLLNETVQKLIETISPQTDESMSMRNR